MLVEKIAIYPIKSAGNINLTSTKVTLNGLLYDRNFAIINDQNKVITAREDFKLLKLHPKLKNNALYFKEKEELLLNLNTDNTLKRIKVQLFDTLTEVVELAYTSNWISNYLGYNASFVKVTNSIDGSTTSLMDDSPIHLISQESLTDLNNKLETPVTSHNFRPNLIINGFKAYEEETWNRIKIGNCIFQVTKKCTRCSVTTINKITGTKSKELLKTLATYKKDANNITFGVYLKPLNEGVISKNDNIQILE